MFLWAPTVVEIVVVVDVIVVFGLGTTNEGGAGVRDDVTT